MSRSLLALLADPPRLVDPDLPVLRADDLGVLRGEAVFETARLAQIVVDRDGLLIMANEWARALFRIPLSEHGRPLQDLEISY
ncbi:MAG: PAS domain-containing protein, partial [Actinomycetota bacterium]|nr:PAS domain-containing protein [Actinomycetota bacterium]